MDMGTGQTQSCFLTNKTRRGKARRAEAGGEQRERVTGKTGEPSHKRLAYKWAHVPIVKTLSESKHDEQPESI